MSLEEQKIIAAFRALINLPEEKLNQVLSGRRNQKYDLTTFKALPFEGVSVIHNITKAEAAKLQLSQLAGVFHQKLQENGLGHLFAFVDYASFHATTFDLMNESETRAAFNDPVQNQEGYTYQEVRQRVEEVTRQFLKIGNGADYSRPNLKAKVKVTGIGMFAPHVVKLDIAFAKEEEKEQFDSFRETLQQYLVEEIGEGYLLVRDKLRPLSTHLTIGYTMNAISEPQIQTLINILRQMNEKFQTPNEYAHLEFEMTQGVLTAFMDMDHYVEI